MRPLLTKSRSRALGAIGAQASQALASFALQILAARLLGLDGLGRFAALYALLILATAVCSGFVGDSLTVLDRSQPAVRSGLQFWLGTLSLTTGALGWLTSWLAGFVDFWTAATFGAATTVFIVEDALRRILMAGLRFWRIIMVDLTSLVTSLAVITVSKQRDLLVFVLALLVGQLAASLVAIVALPRYERWVAGPRRAAVREVAGYGAWRAIQQAVRPALLAAVRMCCVILVGVVATGQLEAARIYMAPALLVIGGLASFLFATYAKNRDAPLQALVRRADRSVLGLLAFVAVFGVLAVAAMPLLGPVLTGGRYALSVASVVGWAAYVASVAAVMPYGTLAATRGRPVAVLVSRLTDSAVSLSLAVLALWLTHSSEWVPAMLAIGSLLGGLYLRHFLLRRMVASSRAGTEPSPSLPPASEDHASSPSRIDRQAEDAGKLTT